MLRRTKLKDVIPSLPAHLDADGAAVWVVSVLYRGMLEHGWPKGELRRALLVALMVPLLRSSTAEEEKQLLADIATLVGGARAIREGTKNVW